MMRDDSNPEQLSLIELYTTSDTPPLREAELELINAQPSLAFKGRQWFMFFSTEQGTYAARIAPMTEAGRLELDNIANAHGINTRDMDMAYIDKKGVTFAS